MTISDTISAKTIVADSFHGLVLKVPTPLVKGTGAEDIPKISSGPMIIEHTTSNAAVINKTMDGDSETMTLTNGVTNGQFVHIILVVKGGASILTVKATTQTGWTSLSFNAVGLRATLLFIDAVVGWVVVSTSGAVLSSSTAALNPPFL